MKRALPANLAITLAVVGVLAVTAVPHRDALGQVTARDLQGRIDELVAYIKQSQHARGALGAEGKSQWAIGQTALAILALRAAGVPPDDPAITGGTAYLLGRSGEGSSGVYQISLKTMALQSVDSAGYRREIAAGARYLMRVQQGSGGWSYRETGKTDHSNSQFALLGLHAAALSGVEVPDEVWESARVYFRAGQNADGGWGYRSRQSNSYGSMTAAGVASIHICDTWLHVSKGRCGLYPDGRPVQNGLSWLARHFSVTRNPRHERWKFYYLYALERTGVILARRYFGPHDWYREGVEHMVGDADRLIYAPSNLEWLFLQKCFMLLFLAKGNAPILIHKAQWSGRWNSYRYDAKFLVHYIGRELGQPLDWQVVPLDAPLDQLMAAPILYISGEGAARWSPEEKARLTQYMDAGGIVLAEAIEGDKGFDQAFRRLTAELFPEDPLAPLPRDHPLYTSYFKLPAGERPPLEAVTGPCWISLLYAPEGLSCPWDVGDFEHINFKLGTNIAAYATGFEKLEGKLVKPVYYVPSDRESAPRRGAFTLGQVVHGSDWRPHKRAWPRVLEQVNQKAGIGVYSRPLPISLDAESPFQAHMLYITGVHELNLSAKAKQALKLYVERGGFVFAEAACGSERFDKSFRQVVKDLFPDQDLRVLPVGHPLYEGGEPLGEVRYSAGAPGLKRPFLEFIEQGERTVLVYSKYDLSSAIDGHPCYQCPSVLEPSASRLALKVVLYGLSS